MGKKILQQSNPIQDSTSILQRKLELNNMIEKIANNGEKVVVASILSPSFVDQETNEECIFSCGSCPRKFSSQQAMAGHRNTHRSEWEPIKFQEKLPFYPEPSAFPNTTIDDPKRQSFENYHSTTLTNTSNAIPSPSPQFPLAKPTNILKGMPICVHQHSMHKANPTNAFKGPALGYAVAKADPSSTLKGPDARGYTLAKANASSVLKGPATGYLLAMTNPISTLKGPPPGYPLAMSNPTSALKGPTPGYHLAKANPTSALKGPAQYGYPLVKAIPTNTLKKAIHMYPLGNPTNILIGPSVPSPQYIFPKPTNSLIGPSLGVAHYTFVPMTNAINMPSMWEQKHLLEKCSKPHGKSALGVRYESMIHKPCQGKLGKTDTWLKVGSTSSGRQQMIGGKIRHFGVSNKNVGLNLSTSTVSTFPSMYEGRGNNKAHDFLSSSFQPINDKGKKAQGIFAPTPTQEGLNHDVDHSLQGLVMHWDNNGENESFLDVDLDLKL